MSYIPILRAWGCAAVLLAHAGLLAEDLQTTAEKTDHQRTGRYAEVERLCHAYERSFPRQVRCVTFGETPEHRPMLALVASKAGVLDAARARAQGVPVVLAQGGIHAGEIDGKDAGFQVLRTLLQEQKGQDILRQLTWVFVPVFNVDGHERFGPGQRPNQRGPAEMGWRVTAQNLNLNRDYVKAEAPEMRAMHAFLQSWDPILYIDLHVTDGARFQHDVAVLLEPRLEGHPRQRALGAELSRNVQEQLKKDGHLPLDFYPSFNKDDIPESGFSVGVPPPRYQFEYWALRHRFGVLVETHSWHDYPHRVRTTQDTLLALLSQAAAHGRDWLQAARQADEATLSLPGKELGLAFDNTEEATTIPFLGYAYHREPSPISGTLRLIYDEKAPVTWNVPFHGINRATLTTRAPLGYLVPPAFVPLVRERLAVHGIRSEPWRQKGVGKVERFRVIEKKFAPAPYEGRMTVKVQGAWESASEPTRADWMWVPVGQPLGELAVQMLEPSAPDSLVSWGYFNAVLEQKEYMEDYVAEEVAPGMLEADPALKEEFEHRLSSDAAFAKDPEARLQFFYRHHPSWDARMDLYPILRVMP